MIPLGKLLGKRERRDKWKYRLKKGGRKRVLNIITENAHVNRMRLKYFSQSIKMGIMEYNNGIE